MQRNLVPIGVTLAVFVCIGAIVAFAAAPRGDTQANATQVGATEAPRATEVSRADTVALLHLRARRAPATGAIP